MNILLTNDDGIFAPGLRALHVAGGSVPVEGLAPSLKNVVRGVKNAVPPSLLGETPPGVEAD